MRTRYWLLLAPVVLMCWTAVTSSAPRGAAGHTTTNGTFPQACPNITVECTDGPVVPGTALTYTLKMTGVSNQQKLTYKWKLSEGVIASGQGTASITVDSKELAEKIIKAGVEVGGLNSGCVNVASCTSVVGKRPEAYKFDEFSYVMVGDRIARLDNFAIELQNDPGTQGYFIYFAGRRQRPQALKVIKDSKEYLVNTRGIDESRFVTDSPGDNRTTIIELWVVPTGAQPPVIVIP